MSSKLSSSFFSRRSSTFLSCPLPSPSSSRDPVKNLYPNVFGEPSVTPKEDIWTRLYDCDKKMIKTVEAIKENRDAEMEKWGRKKKKKKPKNKRT